MDLGLRPPSIDIGISIISASSWLWVGMRREGDRMRDPGIVADVDLGFETSKPLTRSVVPRSVGWLGLTPTLAEIKLVSSKKGAAHPASSP